MWQKRDSDPDGKDGTALTEGIRPGVVTDPRRARFPKEDEYLAAAAWDEPGPSYGKKKGRHNGRSFCPNGRVWSTENEVGDVVAAAVAAVVDGGHEEGTDG